MPSPTGASKPCPSMGACAMLSRTLGTQPAAATRRLRDEIAAGRPSQREPTRPQHQEDSAGVGRHNLLASLTSFVGREGEIREIKRLLSMTRLLTLTGTGDSGKTRLALEVARDLVGIYPEGVWVGVGGAFRGHPTASGGGRSLGGARAAGHVAYRGARWRPEDEEYAPLDG